jgi:hypothetical protein
MQLDQPEKVERELPEITQELPKPRPEVSGPNPKVPEQSMKLTGLNPDIQEQQTEPSMQEKDTQTVEEPQAQRNQQIPSPAKGEGAQESTTGSRQTKEQEIPEAQKEPESTPGQSATST